MFSWLRNKFAGEAGVENERLRGLLDQASWVNAALNVALGHARKEHAEERQERLAFLGALALQNGGGIVLPHTFIQAVQDGGYSLTIGPTEDKQALHIRLEPSAAAEHQE